MQEHIDSFCNTLPNFEFTSTSYDINHIKCYLTPIYVDERCIEPIVFVQANQLVWFKFGNVQLPDFLTFLGSATIFDSIVKADKISERNGTFPYEKFSRPDKVANNEVSPGEAFHIKQRKYNPLEEEYLDYEKLIC